MKFPAVETVMLCVVAPVLQMFPVAELEVKTTEPLAQNVSGPPAEMVGVGIAAQLATPSTYSVLCPVAVNVLAVVLSVPLALVQAVPALSFRLKRPSCASLPAVTNGLPL